MPIHLLAVFKHRYVDSRSDKQLRGLQDAKASKDCSPQYELGGDASQIIRPCGLAAWSYFNDTFQACSRSNDMRLHGNRHTIARTCLQASQDFYPSLHQRFDTHWGLVFRVMVAVVHFSDHCLLGSVHSLARFTGLW